MLLGTSAVRKWLGGQLETLVARAPGGALAAACLAGFQDDDGTWARADRLVAAIEAAGADSGLLLRSIYDRRDYLYKPSQWIVGGDGWAYDIGYGYVYVAQVAMGYDPQQTLNAIRESMP